MNTAAYKDFFYLQAETGLLQLTYVVKVCVAEGSALTGIGL